MGNAKFDGGLYRHKARMTSGGNESVKDELEETKLTLGFSFLTDETSKWNSMEREAASQLKLMSEIDRKELITLLAEKSVDSSNEGEGDGVPKSPPISTSETKKGEMTPVGLNIPEFQDSEEWKGKCFFEPKLFQASSLPPTSLKSNMEEKLKNLISPCSSAGEESFKPYNSNNGSSHQKSIEKSLLRDRDRSSDEEVNGKRKKKRLTRHQSQVLSCMFPDDASLSQVDKSQLAKQLNLDSRQLSVWFQNRKARSKQKHAEEECEKLKRLCTELLKENMCLKEALKEKNFVCSKCLET